MTSQIFCCASCYGPVALIMQPGGDLTYECQKCQRVVSVDSPEALALIEDVVLELHAKEVARVAA